MYKDPWVIVITFSWYQESLKLRNEFVGGFMKKCFVSEIQPQTV